MKQEQEVLAEDRAVWLHEEWFHQWWPDKVCQILVAAKPFTSWIISCVLTHSMFLSLTFAYKHDQRNVILKQPNR